MVLGAAVGTYALARDKRPVRPLPTVSSRLVPGGVPVFAIFQLFAINSLDLYSSGVTLQAIGLRLKRWQAVLVDTVIAGGLTTYAIFSSSFTTLLGLRRLRHRLDWPWWPSSSSTGPCAGSATSRPSCRRAAGGSTGARAASTGRPSWPSWPAWSPPSRRSTSTLQFYLELRRGRTPPPGTLCPPSYGFGGDFSVFLGMGVGGLVDLRPGACASVDGAQ